MKLPLGSIIRDHCIRSIVLISDYIPTPHEVMLGPRNPFHYSSYHNPIQGLWPPDRQNCLKKVISRSRRLLYHGLNHRINRPVVLSNHFDQFVFYPAIPFLRCVLTFALTFIFRSFLGNKHPSCCSLLYPLCWH